MGLRQLTRRDLRLHNYVSHAGKQILPLCRSFRRPVRAHAAGPQLLTSAPAPPGLRPEPWTNSPVQLDALASLMQRFSKESYPPDEATLKWYLRDRYFDVDEAEQKLRSMLTWRATFQPQATTPQMIAAEAASGKAYVHTCPDVYGRPVLIIRTRLHVAGQFPLNDSKRFAAHLIDTTITRIPPGGEQIVGVFDLRGFQFPRNADFAFMAFMIELFFEYYPRRVAQVLLVEPPWVFLPAWEAIKPLMRKYQALVRFLSVEQLRSEYFTRDTLPQDFR